jgi:hypothetical protein
MRSFGRQFRVDLLGLVLLLLGCRGAEESARADASAEAKAPARAADPTRETTVAEETPGCARADGYLRALELAEPPAGFRVGDDLVDEPLALDDRLEFRIVGEPTFDEGRLRVAAVLANPTNEPIDLDVVTGGVAGLSSLPFTLRLDPPPRSHPGLGQESFTAPEVYPGVVRWTIPASSELHLSAYECVARHDLSPGTRLRIHYALQTASEPKPRGTLEARVPEALGAR